MKKNNKKGFTLVELVIVIAVMAALVAVAIPTVGAITGSANTAVENSNARTIESMIKLAEANASKDGDSVAKLTADAIDKALTDAKLGIEEGTYVYSPATGTVKYAGEGVTAAKGDFEITFDAAGTVNTDAKTDTTITVTEKTA